MCNKKLKFFIDKERELRFLLIICCLFILFRQV